MKKIVTFSILFLLPVFGVKAQQIASTRLISLGGLSTVVSTDIDAIGTNPANLISISEGTIAIEFIPFSINAGSDFLSLDLYNKYMTGTGQTDSAGKQIGTFLTQSDKQDILDAFPSGVGNVRANVDIRDFGFSIRLFNFALGFAIDDKVGEHTTVPNSPFSFVLNGLQWGSSLSLNSLDVQSYWYRTYNASYAMQLPDILPIPTRIASSFEIGIGLKFVTGFSYNSIQTVNTSIYADSANHAFVVTEGFNSTRAGLISRILSKSVKSSVGDTNVDFNPFTPEGTGLGLDFGASAKIINFIKVGMSFTDIGWITWSKDVINTKGDTSFTFEGFDPARTNIPGSKSNLDSLNNAFKDYFKNKDSVGSSFSTSLPTRMNIGASAYLDELFPAIPGQLLVAIDYHQGFNNQFNNSTVPQFVLGAEWKPARVIPIRTGLSFGGAFGFRWSFGFGLDLSPWNFDVGIGTFNALVAPTAAKNVSVTLSILKFRF